MSVKAENPEKPPSLSIELNEQEIKDNSWAIRPCFVYREEYDDCTSIRGRFHQYFIHGESIDCTQWQRDFENCLRLEDSPNDLQSAKKIIDSEAKRREIRFKAHYANNVWTKRTKPPDDWAKPLPEWLQKKNENTYLDIKSKEFQNNVDTSKDRTLCVIM